MVFSRTAAAGYPPLLFPYEYYIQADPILSEGFLCVATSIFTPLRIQSGPVLLYSHIVFHASRVQPGGDIFFNLFKLQVSLKPGA